MKKQNRGGKREGAGRKPLNKKQFATRISIECIDMLEDLHFKTERTKVDIIESAIKKYHSDNEKGLTQSK